MFFARFLFFSMAMLFSHLQADEVRKQPWYDDHTIQIHNTVASQKNISRLASLKLADKEKKSVTDNSTNLDADSFSHDDLPDNTKRTSYRFIIHSPHLDQLKKIAADFKKNITVDFKEKMHRLKDLIKDDDEHEPMLLPLGVDNHSIKNQLPEDENLLPQNHAMLEITSAAGIAATTGSSAASATFTAALANAAAATTTAATTIATPVIAATTTTTVTTVVAAPVAVATNAGVCASIGSGITWIGTTIGAIATAPATIAAAAGLSAGALVLYLFGESPSATKARHAAEKLAAEEAAQATARANSLKESAAKAILEKKALEAAEKVTQERIAREKLLQQAAEQERLKKLEAEKIRLANEAAQQAERETKTLRDAIAQAKHLEEQAKKDIIINLDHLPKPRIPKKKNPEKILGKEEDYPVVCMPKINGNAFLNKIINSNQIFDEKSHYKIYDDEFNKKYSHLGIDPSVVNIGTTFILKDEGTIPDHPILGIIYIGLTIKKILEENKMNSGGGGGDDDDDKDKDKKDKDNNKKFKEFVSTTLAILFGLKPNYKDDEKPTAPPTLPTNTSTNSTNNNTPHAQRHSVAAPTVPTTTPAVSTNSVNNNGFGFNPNVVAARPVSKPVTSNVKMGSDGLATIVIEHNEKPTTIADTHRKNANVSNIFTPHTTAIPSKTDTHKTAPVAPTVRELQPTYAPAAHVTDDLTWSWRGTTFAPQAPAVTDKTKIIDTEKAHTLRKAAELAAQEAAESIKRANSLRESTEKAEKEKRKLLQAECEEIKSMVAMLIGLNEDASQSIIIPLAIDCDENSEKEKGHENNRPKGLGTNFSVQGLDSFARLVMPILSTTLMIPDHDDDKNNAPIISFEKHFNDNQRNLHNQQRNEIVSNNIKRSKEDMPHTIKRLADAGYMKSTAGAVSIIGASYGYGGDQNAQIVTTMDTSLHKKHFVVPSSPRLAPYPLPTTSQATESFKKRDADYAKEDKDIQKKADAAQKSEKKDQQKTAQQQQKAALEKAEIDRSTRIKIANDRIESMLPSGFRGAKDKHGNYQKDKNNNPIDKNGNSWHWNEKTKKFDVFNQHKKLMTSVKPATATSTTPSSTGTPTKPESPVSVETTVPAPQPSPVLDHPMPPREEPKQGGCGGDKVEIPTDTAHTPHPDADKVDKLPKGCGHPTKTPEELADKMILHAEKAEVKTWTGSDGKTRNVGDLSGLDVKFREDNKGHIFKDRKGHVIDTPENRNRILDLVKDPTKYVGPPSDWGNWWYGEILPDGTQLWAEVRGEKIINCGLNEVPKEYNEGTGYSSPKAPGNNNTK